ncbi:MAG: protein TolR [Alteromonadaceae bacterium]|uniref:Tol-Pal system protein TolR n=2 Tax=Hydrocarboniclastica marina TaxID=2259620 RepID=A0A4P7XFR7_9ALTE|nr:protein TolR [Alteromonadaceae bacterium]QCF25819.1 protein TolR [Hydrocarboniclastica marina]
MAMNQAPRPRRKSMSDINVVPYIDVMLVLLVIFMITAPMLTQGVSVELPQTTSEPIDMDKDAEPVIVSVDADGAYYLDAGEEPERALSIELVQAQVEKILAQRPDANVLVRGDHKVAYGTVVSLMSRLQQVGAQRVGLITEEPQG